MTLTFFCFSGEDSLAFLRNTPQFQQMRELVQTDPSVLPAILQQIGQTRPELLQVTFSAEFAPLKVYE